MPKDEWGVKRVCPHCSNLFYDLRTDPMTCPNCGTTFALDSLTMAKPKALRPEKAKVAPEDLDDLPDIEAEDEAIEDGEELDDEILEDDDDNVDLEDIADVAADDEEP